MLSVPIMGYNSPASHQRPVLQSRTTSASDSSSQSHQTGAIKEHWNDLPTNFTPTTSRSVSRTGTPLSRNGNGTPAGADGAGGALDFDSLLSALLESPTCLSPNDLKLLGSKIQKVVPTISPEQKSDLGFIFRAVAVDRKETPAWGRERVVEFMMREKGVSSWAIAVRKIVESVV